MLKFRIKVHWKGYTGDLTIEHQTLTGILAQLGELDRAGIENVQTDWERNPRKPPHLPQASRGHAPL